LSVVGHRAKSRELLPGEKIRVLVVDDSVVIRRLVTHALSEDSAIEVAGTAADGSIALSKIPQVQPHVITLDVEMPNMNGLETLKQIRAKYPSTVVIMFSTLTSRGTSITMEALMAGADDYVTKAANVGSLDESLGRLRAELLPKIFQFFRHPNSADHRAAAAIPRGTVPITIVPRQINRHPRVVVIGVSTGGPSALAAVMSSFPPDFRLPILIVQHMPPVFTKQLANQLQHLSRLHVSEAQAGEPIQAGHAYIAPGDFHMRIARGGSSSIIALEQTPPENSCRPAVDVLFRSAAEIYGGSCIAVILTGMGQDGCKGSGSLRALGAPVIIQDEASSVVWGMPGSVARAGFADAIVDIKMIVPEILKFAK
jgi:two-component system chemotaxis response regulator CheB